MPFVEAAIIAAEIAAEEAAAAAAAEAATAAVAEAAAAGATEAAAATAAETAATAAAEAVAADTAATVAAPELAAATPEGILQAAPEIVAEQGATGVAEAAPELTQTAATEGAEATQAAATDVAQGTAQQPAGLEQVTTQQPAGVEPTTAQQPAGIDQVQPQTTAEDMAKELQTQISQAQPQPMQGDQYAANKFAEPTYDVKPISADTPQELPGSNWGTPEQTPTPTEAPTTPQAPAEPAPQTPADTGGQSVSEQTGGKMGNGTENLPTDKVGKSPFEQGLDKAMKYVPLGIMAAGVAGSFSQDRNGQAFPSTSYSGPLNKYKLSSNFQASTAQPNVYKPKYAADGGIMQVGPVERMSNNAIGANRMYPQGQQENTQFATPTQMPASAEIVRSDYDARTNPYTGQEVTMASGGKAKSSFEDNYDYYASMLFGEKATPEGGRGDPGIYRDTDPSTRTKSALDATKIRLGKIMSSANIPEQRADIPSGNLGIIDVGPANVKKKDSAKDDDEFARGGIAQVNRYADGGQADDQPNAVTPAPTLGDYAARAPGTMQYLSSQNPAIMSQLSGMGPQQDVPVQTTQAAATPFQYAPIQRSGISSQTYQMEHPVADQVYIARKAAEEAARKSAEEASRRAAEDSNNSDSYLYSYAGGGIAHYNLGGYSDGGRLLRGPGDGMSDNIPASIGDKQPARLADGEFVFPADVVSALGNGSTEAGARHLYKMMDKIRQEAHGKKTQQKKVNPKKVMPK